MSFLRLCRKFQFSSGSIFDGVESPNFLPEAFSTASKVSIFFRKHFRRRRKSQFSAGSIFDSVESPNFFPEAFSTASKVPIFLRKRFRRRRKSRFSSGSIFDRCRKSRFSSGSIFDGVESSNFPPEAFSTASKWNFVRQKVSSGIGGSIVVRKSISHAWGMWHYSSAGRFTSNWMRARSKPSDSATSSIGFPEPSLETITCA